MSDEPEAPADHPNPRDWWWHILWQSWFALAGAVIESILLIVFGAPKAGAALLVLNVGLVAAIFNYGGGSTLIGFAKAWRGHP